MAKEILVRMYNVGFGDCFLVEYPGTGGATRRILVDCGSIAAGPLAMTDVVEQILADTQDESGVSHIDVLVCTHRHADHVSGFGNPKWKQVQIKEVWFPWTEDPDDEAATEIRESQARLALALVNRWSKLAPGQEGVDAEGSMPLGEAQAPWHAMALNALTNQKAMTMLHEGIASRPKAFFLSSDGNPKRVRTEALPEINAFVLGPSKSPDIIRDMDPPAGKTYLRQQVSRGGTTEELEPFSEDWPIDPSQFAVHSDWQHLTVSDAHAKRIEEAGTAWDPAVTVALEQAVNGTSLILAFEIGEAVLFFPGDAQWGTWNAMLKKSKARALIERAEFWKVGHHGSHNATPQEFVESLIGRQCCAMMSTKKGKWASIPRLPLLDAVKAKGIELARSDGNKNSDYKRFAVWNKSRVETRLDM
jgi:beta-lactamase superfamily II metal-dependent hydrolase